MSKMERQRFLMIARFTLQKVLRELPREQWQVAARNFTAGANIELRKMQVEETDLMHLLPSFSSDPDDITFNDVMKCYDN